MLSDPRRRAAGCPGRCTQARDHTELERANEQITRLSSFPDENPNPAIETDLAGTVRYLNPAARLLMPDIGALTARHPLLDGIQDLIPSLRSGDRMPIGNANHV